MRRTLILSFALLLMVTIVGPASAKQGDVVKIKATYSIPEDLGQVEDLGELNAGCSSGLYTLVDGTFKKNARTTYFPSKDAWLAGDIGATKTHSGINTYVGLWDLDTQPGALFELKDNNIHYEFTTGTDGSESGSIRWSGSFENADTGEVAEWWRFDVSWEGEIETGIQEGTC